jgi:hypothetical protein
MGEDVGEAGNNGSDNPACHLLSRVLCNFGLIITV